MTCGNRRSRKLLLCRLRHVGNCQIPVRIRVHPASSPKPATPLPVGSHEPTRRLARAAGIELKRRGVLSRDDHLRSAEPDGFACPDATGPARLWAQPRFDGSIDLPRQPGQLSFP